MIEQDFLDDLDVETGLNPTLDIYPNITVKISRAQYSAFQIKRMVEDTKQILLDPEFQRNPVWKSNQKIELIESILMGIPLPVIYLFEDKYGNKQMVDGRQRISAIIDFMNNNFSLNKLKMLPDFNGKKFSELEPIYRNKIEDYQLSTYIIEPPTPEQVKYDIFDRVNRGGTKLNNQEMRNALYYGKSTVLIKELSESEVFKRATGNGISTTRMKDRYVILRLISFFLLRQGKLNFEYKSDIDEFLALAMSAINKINAQEIEIIQDKFIQSMHECFNILGENAFRFNVKDEKKRPINMALFESIGYFFMLKNDIPHDQNKLKYEVEELKNNFNISDSFKNSVDSSKSIDFRLSAVENLVRRLSC